MDRISELPEHILHGHILSLLSQDEAVRTCLLSKSWRHLGPTRPKIEFDDSHLLFINKRKFLSVVENTLQRYVDQKLPIQEFIVSWEKTFRGPTVHLLNKWIPKVLMNMGVKKFELTAADYLLPSVVFQAEFLEELSLNKGCRIDNYINVKLQMLKRLELHEVHIEDEAFEKIMSNCPLIEYVHISGCDGLRHRTIKVNTARNLKYFAFVCSCSIGFNDEAPSLETISLSWCKVWYENYYFPQLKYLCLDQVHLPTEFLNNLNCPFLEKFELYNCSGFTEFKLSNRSIKHLSISVSESHPIEVISIDAANMIYFEFTLISVFIPSIVSFAMTTSSSECESHIHVMRRSSDVSNEDDFPSTWSLELYEFLKALSSQSQIYLDISCFPLTNQDTFDSSCEPVEVEYFCLSAKNYCSSSELPSFFNRLFRICRPRYVGTIYILLDSDPQESLQLAEKIWKALGKKRQCKIWKQGLQKISIQVLDEKTEEWRPGQVCEFSNNPNIWFWLKWKKSKH